MRLEPIAPTDLGASQKPVYDMLRAGIAKQFEGFKTEREDGALLGPFNAWVHEPSIGAATWSLTQAVSDLAALPDAAKQVAILVTGARFHAAFELYAHVEVAGQKGLAEAKVATIAAGQRPVDLDDAESIAFDVASALNAGGVLPRAIYARAKHTFGPRGVAELVYLVGLYAMVSVTLNGFDVPVPEQQDGTRRTAA